MIPPNAYAGWRAAALTSSFLHEPRDGLPGERILQLVWQHQRLRPDQLRLADGRRVRILHPGFWNHGAGPDFRNAVIRIEGEPAGVGDVELDVHPRGWREHRHHLNPRYRGVVLQVVWRQGPDATPAALPVLPLEGRLDAPLEELIAWVDLDPGLPDNVIGRCASRLRHLAPAVAAELLRQAALFRLHRKALDLGARAREVGWDQTLWEGLAAALGYQHNAWPLRRLAECRQWLAPCQTDDDPLACQARLLGASGLLPHDPPARRSPSHAHLRRLWDLWWRERHRLDGIALPRAAWHLAGVRPANHPQRRLALLAHWLTRPRLVTDLEQWFAQTVPDSRLRRSLLGLLQVEEDAFWSWHWTLASPALSRPQPLLGETRTTDLAINILLPWFWARADAGAHEDARREAERRFLVWPAAQDNTVLQLARMRLFAGHPTPVQWTAARQQGLLQCVRDFCGHSNALCDACPFPARLNAISGSQLASEHLRSPP